MAKEKKHVLQDGQLQKNRREFREMRLDLKDELANSGMGIELYRSEKKFLKGQIRKAKREIAIREFQGNNHALMLTELRQENQEMEELLKKVNSDEPVRARRGAKVTLQDFALKQAFGLAQCSRKAIYQHNKKTGKFTFKHMMRCGRRTCPVCSHFRSLKEGKLLLDEMQDKLSRMSKDELKNGRLFLITLTHENVPLDRVFEISKVWRRIQQMKSRKYKKKDNPYSIWNVLKWGVCSWEVTRNEDTGLYHPHIHVMAFVNGWLAPEKGGYWNRLVESWNEACAKAGLNTDWDGQDASPILYFREERGNDPRALGYNFTREELAEVVEGAVAEMSKYAVKSTEFTKIKRFKGESDERIANEMAKLFAMMAGRKLKNGFGGFSLRGANEEGEEIEESDPEQPEAEEEAEDLSEVIYAWDRKQKRYVMQAWRPWSNERFADYLQDMRCYKDRHTLMLYYGLEREAA